MLRGLLRIPSSGGGGHVAVLGPCASRVASCWMISGAAAGGGDEVAGENALSSSLLLTSWSSSSRRMYSQSTRSQAISAPPKPLKIPPNLHIDPRSSFAPQPGSMFSEVDDDEDDVSRVDDDEDDDEDDDDDEDEDEALYINMNQDTYYAVPLPNRLNVEVHTLFAPEHSSKVGTLWLEENVFGRDPIRVDLIKRAVDYWRCKKRGRRKAKTKTIGEVSGSGRKIRRQKGSGMARVGHSRPPHFRGGAKAHGPKNVTDYGNTKLNKKVRKLALCHALSQKLKEGNLVVLDQLRDLPSHKTKELARLLEPWDIGGKSGGTAVILDHYEPDEEQQRRGIGGDGDDKSDAAVPESYRGVPANLWVAAKNIKKILVGNHYETSIYNLLKYEKLVLTLAAVEKIEDRLRHLS